MHIYVFNVSLKKKDIRYVTVSNCNRRTLCKITAIYSWFYDNLWVNSPTAALPYDIQF